jgi:hypothetical protein
MLACNTVVDTVLPRQNLRASLSRSGTALPTPAAQKSRRYSVMHSDRPVYLQGKLP